jgi:hypothetical protein
VPRNHDTPSAELKTGYFCPKAQEGKLVTRSERWNLVFTDFLYDNFKQSSLNTLVSLLTLDKDICCRLLDQDKGCACPENFEVCRLLGNTIRLRYRAQLANAM